MARSISAPIALSLVSAALLVSSPAQAYDPCERATNQMLAARAAYDNATCSTRNCSGDARYWRLFQAYLNAYERMRQQCR
jgi:hypothetical protein